MSFIFYIIGILLAALGSARLYGVPEIAELLGNITELTAGFLIVAGSIFIVGGGVAGAIRRLSKTILDNLDYDDDDRIPPSIDGAATPASASTAAVSAAAASSPATSAMIMRIKDGLAAGKGIKGMTEDLKASGAKHPATGKAWTLEQVQEIRDSY